MLSSLLEILNRERTLSFSAAICLLTVTAAALPGLFNQDDPFANASLWEGKDGNRLAKASAVSTELPAVPGPVSYTHLTLPTICSV